MIYRALIIPHRSCIELDIATFKIKLPMTKPLAMLAPFSMELVDALFINYLGSLNLKLVLNMSIGTFLSFVKKLEFLTVIAR